MRHKHYNAMIDYAIDAGDTDKPWKKWQYRVVGIEHEWSSCIKHPEWFEHHEYRRKPTQEQIDIEAFNHWWLQKGGFSEKRYPSEAWTAALAWERSRNGQ